MFLPVEPCHRRKKRVVLLPSGKRLELEHRKEPGFPKDRQHRKYCERDRDQSTAQAAGNKVFPSLGRAAEQSPQKKRSARRKKKQKDFKIAHRHCRDGQCQQRRASPGNPLLAAEHPEQDQRRKDHACCGGLVLEHREPQHELRGDRVKRTRKCARPLAAEQPPRDRIHRQAGEKNDRQPDQLRRGQRIPKRGAHPRKHMPDRKRNQAHPEK